MTLEIAARPVRLRPGFRLRRAWARRNRRFDALAAALAATLGFTLYFLVFPQFDLTVSGVFHGPDGFALGQSPVLKRLRKSSTWVLAGALATVLTVLVMAARRDGAAGLMRAHRAWSLLLGLALGPGLVVNALLKSLWGRPRPVHLDQFGGDAPYTLVWRMSDWCQSNCSFTSGEAASAAWIAAAAALAPSPWRERLLVPALAYAAALSVNRIAAGGHFVSDVVLSWTLVATVVALLHGLLAPRALRRRNSRPAVAAAPS